jgi:LAO/AO transport system ATPase
LTGRHETNSVALFERVLAGDLAAIARAITAIENETPQGLELWAAVRPHAGRSRTIGVTGPPGAGKSSLINALIDRLLPLYRRIGVLTVDPTSPVTGGAVLGDRVRMAAHSRNPNVFIRSLAARGHLGGVTRMTRAVIDLLDAAGMNLVIVETVGTGQSEIEIASLTSIRLVICPPNLGDEMQAIKAGVLEIADILVVNKADLAGAERTAAQLRNMLAHRGSDETRSVVLTSATGGMGLDQLVGVIASRLNDCRSPEEHESSQFDDARRQMLVNYAATVLQLYLGTTDDRRVEDMLIRLSSGRVSYGNAVRELFQFFLDTQKPAASLAS